MEEDIKIKKPKDKKITNYNHNPKDESMIYYKTEAKNNITETQEDNNLFNALETEINKESDKYPFNKKIIINKNKKVFYQKNIENNKHKTLNKKTNNKNNIYIIKEDEIKKNIIDDTIINEKNEEEKRIKEYKKLFNLLNTNIEQFKKMFNSNNDNNDNKDIEIDLSKIKYPSQIKYKYSFKDVHDILAKIKMTLDNPYNEQNKEIFFELIRETPKELVPLDKT